ncbi:hypothetical protein L6164_013690 [Bauhinia variegata]|uniref:Uncharacterized protein n=1 Tax=Bauhinia variegata TaxID=167791 RepID=A0ACB9NJV1_BAUVA|nr:hypothetical protein L6164_013690 [Bauhinia variegata]
MAGHNESRSSEKKSSNGLDDLPTFNAENMQSNMEMIYYSRTFLSIIGGVVSHGRGLMVNSFFYGEFNATYRETRRFWLLAAVFTAILLTEQELLSSAFGCTVEACSYGSVLSARRADKKSARK